MTTPTKPAVQWSDLKKIADQYGFNSPHYAAARQAMLTEPLVDLLTHYGDQPINPLADGPPPKPPKEKLPAGPKQQQGAPPKETLPKARGGPSIIDRALAVARGARQ